jgi:hypothetical protein
MLNNKPIAVGEKIRFSTTHSDGSVILYSAPVVKIESRGVWVAIPARVRALPFPPCNGKRFALYTHEYAAKWRK